MRIAFSLFFLLFGDAALAEVVVRDDTGKELRLPRPARRIVSLAPHVTENLFAAGAGGSVVGTVDYSDYPETARRLPRVGGYSKIDLEAVAALKPDLIVGWESGNAPASIANLRGLGLPVYLDQPQRIDDVSRSLERFGELAGTRAIADAEAKRFRDRLETLASNHARRPRVRVFYQVWKQPLHTVNGKQIISDAIRLCGGENVFADLPLLAPTVTVEAVLAADPEVIVASGTGDSSPEWLEDWRRWPSLTAVARDNLFFVPPQLIQRHTPRLLDGAERLCRHLENARTRRDTSKSKRP